SVRFQCCSRLDYACKDRYPHSVHYLGMSYCGVRLDVDFWAFAHERLGVGGKHVGFCMLHILQGLLAETREIGGNMKALGSDELCRPSLVGMEEQTSNERERGANVSFLEQIAVLILTYNEAPNIGRVLAALARFTDVVVLDSGSTDGTAEIIA